MTSLSAAKELAAAGQFAQALKALEHVSQAHRRSADVLRGELLVMIGRHSDGRALVGSLLKSRELTGCERSACEFVLGRLDWEAGESDAAIHHFQRSIRLAKEAGDLQRICWSQLRLALIVSDRAGPDAAAPLISELRTNATTLGDRRVIAAVHIFIGEMDAKRGLPQGALRHLRIGKELLSTAPNIWLEALAENVRLAIAVMLSDLNEALQRGQRVLDMTEQSGALGSRRSCLANLGNLLYLMGEFDGAVDYFNRAIASLPSTGVHTIACLDSLAQVRLMQGRLEECECLLERVEQSMQSPSDKTLHVYRYAQLTRIQLFLRQRRLHEALEHVVALLDLTVEARDHRLNTLAILTKAELLAHMNRLPESFAVLEAVVDSLSNYPPDMGAQYERVLSCVFRITGNESASQFHRTRAARIFESLGNVAGKLELSLSCDVATTADLQSSILSEGAAEYSADDQQRTVRPLRIVQGVATVLMHSGYPELLACEFVHLLADADCVQGAAAIGRDAGGDVTVLAATGNLAATEHNAEGTKRLTLNVGGESQVAVIVEPRADAESQATLNAFRLLLATVRDLERARVEREKLLTLWPIDDIPIEDGKAVVSGKMRELMSTAKRIASTNVSVLITGESDPQSARSGQPLQPSTVAPLVRSLGRRAECPRFAWAA